MTFDNAYLFCFVLGIAFVVLSAFLGKFGAGHGDAGHVDGAHAHDLGSHGDHHGGSLPLFSPTVLAVFVGMFGAGGLLMTRVLGVETPLLHLPGALLFSGGAGFGVAWTMMKILSRAEVKSVASFGEVIGRSVEVIAAIRGGGEFGEIAYEAAGTRQTLIAKSADGTAFAQGASVQVLKIEDGVAYVAPVGTMPMLQLEKNS
jgi:hypothetical protein